MRWFVCVSRRQRPDGEERTKFHLIDSHDSLTNAPSSNYLYEFGHVRWRVRGGWREIFSAEADGTARSGTVAALAGALAKGMAVKVGVEGLCAEMADGGSPEHTVFVLCHSTVRDSATLSQQSARVWRLANLARINNQYHATEQGILSAASHLVVRVKPAVPMRYESHGWDFGWLYLRTDG